MRFTAILTILFVVFASHARSETFLAQIKDPEGFTNLRLRPGSDAPIVAKLNRDEKFFVSTSQLLDNPEWFPATTGKQHFGFIHKSRVNLIEKSNDALILVGKSLAQWLKTGVEEPVGAFFKVGQFKKDDHKLIFNSKGGVQSINGHEPYGVDGNVPKSKFHEFAIFFSGNKFQIDPKWYQDCYQADLNKDKLSLNVSQSGKEILLSLASSGGGGAYTATWIMEQTGNIARVITGP